LPESQEIIFRPFIQRQIGNQQDRDFQRRQVDLNGSFRLRCTAAERHFHNHQINGSAVDRQQRDGFLSSGGPQNGKTAAVQNHLHGMSTVGIAIENNGSFHGIRPKSRGPRFKPVPTFTMVLRAVRLGCVIRVRMGPARLEDAKMILSGCGSSDPPRRRAVLDGFRGLRQPTMHGVALGG
jgi:hypothetical protein